MSNATSWPAPDPHTRRRIPETSRPLDRSVVERLLAAEWERFRDWSAGSGRHNVRAGEALPLGVTSSFQHWDPWPITITSARAAEQVNLGALEAIDTVIDEYQLPAHTVGVGLKGCVTWSTSPVRNYRDYKATDFGVAELSWLWGVNRGILTPPGLDEQWLVSLAHTTTDMDQLVGDVRELAKALRG